MKNLYLFLIGLVLIASSSVAFGTSGVEAAESGWPECRLGESTHNVNDCRTRAVNYKGVSGPASGNDQAWFDWAHQEPKPLSGPTACGIAPSVCLPTPTPTTQPTSTPTKAPTPTATTTPVPTSTPTVTPTPGPTSTPVPPVGGGDPEAPICRDENPQAPTLISVSVSGNDGVQLIWSEPDANVDSYAISYGLESGNYIYGVPNTGKTTTYRIGSLDLNRKYYFVVRSKKGCAISDTSNELSYPHSVSAHSLAETSSTLMRTLAGAFMVVGVGIATWNSRELLVKRIG